MINLEEYAGSKEFPLAETGDYEVVLKIERRTTRDGTKEYLNCDFEIRSDVTQNCGGVHIFDKVWADKQNPSWFDLKKLGSILATQKNKEGYRNSFNEVDEFILYINGAHMIVSVEKVYDEYQEKDVNNIKYLSYKPSKWDLTHDPIANEPAQKLEVPEESELPF